MVDCIIYKIHLLNKTTKDDPIFKVLRGSTIDERKTEIVDILLGFIDETLLNNSRI